MVKPIVRLAPGRAGWYDEASRLHLTIANPEAVINDGTNITNIKRAINSYTLLLTQGDLSNEDGLYIDDTVKIKKPVGKGKLSVRFGNMLKKKKDKENVETPEEPEVIVPEQPDEKEEEKKEDGKKGEEDNGKLSEEELPKNDGEIISEDSKTVTKTEEEPEKQEEQKDDDNSMEVAVELFEEIESKINNARAFSGVNGAITMIDKGESELSPIEKGSDKLRKMANDKKIEIIKDDIEKVENDKDIEKIENLVKEIDKKDQKEIEEILNKKRSEIEK